MPRQSLLAKSFQTKAISNNLKPMPAPMGYNYQIVNGRLIGITDNPKNYIDKGFNVNDIVYSIITLIMDKVRISPWSLYTITDEQSLKAYNGLLSKKDFKANDIRLARELRHKAITPVKNPGKWGDILKYPNEYETFSDFVANGVGFKLLTGNKYIWADLIEGGKNAGAPNSLWNLPSQWMNITATQDFPCKILNYIVQLWPEIKYTNEEILHEKYWNPNWNINGEQLYGIAPLRAALKLLNRNNSSLDASTASFQNEGIKGVLYMKNQVGQVDGNAVLPEVMSLKKTMVNEWAGESNYGKMGISGYEVGWLPIGISSKDMQLIENEKWDLRRLCSVWGVSSRLLNDPDNTAEANVEEAEKALTTRCAFPALNSTRDNLNRKLEEWGGKPGDFVDYDMTVYSELAGDTKDTVAWVIQLMDRGLPLNRALELINLEKIDNPYYDQPRVTPGMGQSFDEYEMTEVESLLNQQS